MTELAPFSPDWVSPPGDTIADILEEYSWSQKELAQRLEYSTKHVNQLIKGNAPITGDTALKLERVLGSTARFWLNRESQYQEALVRKQAIDKFQKDADWLKQIPLNEMIKFGWIKAFSHKGQQVAACLNFYAVASVNAWYQYCDEQPIAAFRASEKFEKNKAAIVTWLRQGEREATKIACEPFDKKAFRSKLFSLRALTTESSPQVFVPELIKVCASVGVAVVLEPYPKGCPVSGATRWLSPNKALLMLSLRYKTNDQLWFSFFHEAGHLLLHGKKMLFLEMKALNNEQEQEANQFACDFLIPPNEAQSLANIGQARENIVNFAKHLGIAPGIVVGRMQKEKYIDWKHPLSKLKISYQWNHDDK